MLACSKQSTHLKVLSVTHLVGSRGKRSSASDKRCNDGSLHFDILFVLVGFDRLVLAMEVHKQEVKLKATHSSIFPTKAESLV